MAGRPSEPIGRGASVQRRNNLSRCRFHLPIRVAVRDAVPRDVAGPATSETNGAPVRRTPVTTTHRCLFSTAVSNLVQLPAEFRDVAGPAALEANGAPVRRSPAVFFDGVG